jgi:hypothetical protein
MTLTARHNGRIDLMVMQRCLFNLLGEQLSGAILLLQEQFRRDTFVFRMIYATLLESLLLMVGA